MILKKEKKMPKMKTKSGAKKRFRTTSSGKVKAKNAYARHMMMNKPKSMKRKAKGTTTLSAPDERIVLRNWLPYSRKKKKKATKTAGGSK
jgi:large subunit ribosomal protein L35